MSGKKRGEPPPTSEPPPASGRSQEGDLLRGCCLRLLMAAFATPHAVVPVSAFAVALHACHASHTVAVVGLGVKGFLLLGRQRRVEGLGGLATAVGLGGVLGAHGPHAVDALGGGELVQFLGVGAGGAFARLVEQGSAAVADNKEKGLTE